MNAIFLSEKWRRMICLLFSFLRCHEVVLSTGRSLVHAPPPACTAVKLTCSGGSTRLRRRQHEPASRSGTVDILAAAFTWGSGTRNGHEAHPAATAAQNQRPHGRSTKRNERLASAIILRPPRGGRRVSCRVRRGTVDNHWQRGAW